MNKSEFLKKLKEALQQSVSDGDIKNQLDYYDQYINDEVKKGRTEKEVVEELGDPRLIAKTITTVSKAGGSDQGSNGNNVNDDNDDNSSENKSYNRSKMYTYTSGTSVIGCAIAFLIVFIVIMGLLRFLGNVAYGIGDLAFSGPIGFILVLLIFYLIFGRGRR